MSARTRDRVLLDRYAERDTSAEPSVGNLVMVTIPKVVKGKEGEEQEVGVVARIVDHPSTPGRHLYALKLKEDEKPESTWDVIENVEREWFSVLKETSYFQICDRVVRGVAEVEPKPEFLEPLRQFMHEEAFVLAGRIYAGLGRVGLTLTLFNCFVKQIMGDSKEAIAKHWGEILEIFSRGGGCGWNLSVLRYKGAPVRKSNGRSSGVCGWATNFAMITATVIQGGSRRGAGLQCLAVWHPDALEFTKFKNQIDRFDCPMCQTSFDTACTCPSCGAESRRKQKIWEGSNVSILITKPFMDAVERGEQWNFVFPDTTDPEYDQLWDGDLEAWKKLGKKVDTIRTAPAREVWREIVKNAYETGEPGLLFIDRINEMSNSWYYAPLISTNPCVVGSSRLHTQYGMVPIQELAETKKRLEVTVDRRALARDDFGVATRKAVPAFMTKKRAAVYKVVTKAGYELEATLWHDFYTTRGKIKLRDLCLNDELLIQSGKGQFGDRGDSKLGHLLGLITGDGHFSCDGYTASDGAAEMSATIGLWGKDRVLAPYVARCVNEMIAGQSANNREYTVSPVKVPKHRKVMISSVILARLLKQRHGFSADTKLRVPEVIWRGTEECVKEYLQALFQADGTVNASNKNACSVRLSSSYPDLLRDVQILLANFGVYCTINKRRKAGKRRLPNGKGGSALYKCKTNYEIIIDGESREVFMQEIGFLGKYKTAKYNKWVKSKALKKRQPFKSKVISITYTGMKPVYDTTQDDHNTVIFNGLVTGQCGEQALPKDGVCNLSHLNLAKFILPGASIFPDEECLDANEAWIRIDHAKLQRAASVGVRFLDALIDLNNYYDADMEIMAKGERRIGLGVLGYAELLCRLGLRYGSRTALEFTDRLFSAIKENAYLASVDLAKEKGAFPFFKADLFLQGKFIQTLKPAIRDLIAKWGIRNVTLLTAAPTGSVGAMVGTSTGIEPYIHRKYTAKTRIGATEETINIWDELARKFGSDAKQWPSYVVTSGEISVRGHVETQAAVQRHIDASISKTINAPKTATIEDAEEAYLLLYKLGCKGGTLYRDGSRSEQVFYNREAQAPVPAPTASNVIDVELVSEDSSDSLGVSSLRPSIRFGHCVSESFDSPLSSLHPFLRFHPKTGEPYDFFLEAGKGDVHADAQAMARLISMILRWPNKVTVPQSDRLQLVVKQLFGIHGRGQMGLGPDAVYSQPDGIAKFLAHYLSASYPMPGLPMGTDQVPAFISAIRSCRSEEEALNLILTGVAAPAKPAEEEEHPTGPGAEGHFDLCPNCNGPSLVRVPGHCTYCINQGCGYSECS